MRHKKSVLIGSVILVTLVVAWLVFRHPSDLEWIQQTSGVRLPRGVQDVSIYDNGEAFITAHVQLPAATVSEFARTFVPAPNAHLGLMGMDKLDQRFQSIPQDADLVAYAGRSKENTWTYVLDRRSGHLWITVRYPDMAGDPP